jgi:2-succinyl-6-hydroxy-2,4-cyclohexadiene-1-carboxylate synthase
MDAVPFSLNLRGIRLAGATHGDTPRTVFIHGFGGSGGDWDRVWQALPDSFSALRYDQRGFGASVALDDAPYSHTADLLALLDARGIAQADLIGLSQGGAVALHFAMEHPERVRRLVLISPALFGWSWSDEWKAIWRAASGAARAGDMAAARAHWLAHPMFAQALAGPAAGELAASVNAFPGRQWVSDTPLPETPDADRIAKLAAPTLLLTGGQDFSDFRGIAALLEAEAPDLRRIDFVAAGHLLNLEEPAATAKEIAAFLG